MHAINSIRKLIRLALLVEQWAGKSEVADSSPRSKHIIFGCLQNSY